MQNTVIIHVVFKPLISRDSHGDLSASFHQRQRLRYRSSGGRGGRMHHLCADPRPPVWRGGGHAALAALLVWAVRSRTCWAAARQCQQKAKTLPGRLHWSGMDELLTTCLSPFACVSTVRDAAFSRHAIPPGSLQSSVSCLDRMRTDQLRRINCADYAGGGAFPNLKLVSLILRMRLEVQSSTCRLRHCTFFC